jgi:Skp family chaperone for outer membrane proteins
MDEKSINILMEKKNIFIGKTQYDITNNILDILNK